MMGKTRRIRIKTEDGRYLERIDAWTGSSKVVLGLTDDIGKAILYPNVKRVQEDLAMLNGETWVWRRIRKAVVEKIGDVRFLMDVRYEDEAER